MSQKSAQLHKPGQKFGHFEVTRAIDVPELNCFLTELVHLPSKAKVLHIANDDPENVFCLSFQTLPDSSNGVAHILEHTVLCGSKKYPIKDPFFAMQKRSLNTFMNAFTGADFTCYPAASQVSKDFYNLLEVYLDAVFHPNLVELSFLQEGHRIEFADPENPDSPLEFKGIVFNEMKGALSAPSARLGEEINAALFPNITYGYNSGGDPKDIPKLTYKELRLFHEKYYHPSQCLFYFYGDMPLKDHLDFIATHTLDHVAPVTPLPPIPLQPRHDKPIRIEKNYPISAEELSDDKTFITFAWLTCPVRDQNELLALTMLEIILLDTDASPLKKALMKSGLCKQVGTYMEADVNEVPIVISLSGCHFGAADKLEEILFSNLKQISEKGIPEDLLESAMHQLEFHRSEMGGGSIPFGINLFMRSGLLRQHHTDPEDGLRIHSLFAELRRRIAVNPHYLTDLIRIYFLANNHYVRVVLNPDKDLAAKELAEEKQALEKIKLALTPTEIESIVAKAKELSIFQKNQEDEDTDILPKVTLDDVPKEVKDYPLQKDKLGPLTIYHHDCFTNEILYTDLVFHLPKIPEEDLALIRLLTVIIPQMGCAGRSYSENLDYIQANTGGMSASVTFNMQSSNHEIFYPSMNFRGRSLYRKADKMLPLLHELAHSVDFSDLPRIKEVIVKHYSGLQTGLAHRALKYAMNLSASGLDVSSHLSNIWYGLEYYYKVRELAQNFDEVGEEIAKKLQHYYSLVTGLEDPHLVVGCDEKFYQKLKTKGFYGLDHLKTKPFEKFTPNYSVNEVKSQGRTIASPVAFTGLVFKTVSYCHPDSAALLVAGHLFDNLTLHAAIREQGGAYGGGASGNNLSGNFNFYSYRDPNILATLKAFETSVDEVLKGDFDQEELEEALLEIIQAFDTPVSPESRADVAYGWMREGKPVEVRQAYRNSLLSMTKERVIEAVQKHIKDAMKTAAVVVFADKDLLERENKALVAEGREPFPILQV